MSASPASFAYIREMLQKRSGIALEDDKVYLVDARVGPVAAEAGFPTIDAFLAHLRSAPWGVWHVRTVESLTTNETSFFRDVAPFDALRDHVLPRVLDARKAERTLRIWSAACSTGQEAYSIGMMLRHDFPDLHDWDIRILATDLSEAVLSRARSATYSQLEIKRGVPAAMLVKFFTRTDADWILSREVTSLVTFKPMNFVMPWPEVPAMDIVFMRNVLIYFDNETKRDILTRVGRVLKNDGCLFLGGAETMLNLNDDFKRVPVGRATYYVKEPKRTSLGGSTASGA